MEEKYEIISEQSHASSSSNSSELEIAELVLLNSSRYVRIEITPPTGEDSVIISLYDNSDECNEPGEIGCDCLDEKYEVKEDVGWRNCQSFDSVKDKQIVPELPLPLYHESEYVFMTTIATADTTSMESISTSTQR